MTTSTPPPASGGNAKYAIVGILLLLVASAAIWWALRKPQPPVETARPAPARDAGGAPTGPQIGTQIAIEEEPDAGNDAGPAGDAGRRVRYVYRYVGGNCRGQLDNEAVVSAARQNIGGMRQCYTRALRTNPALRGNVHAHWVINPNGSVGNIQTSISSDPAFKSCFENALRRVHFPTPRGGCAEADFNFPLRAE